MGSEYNFGKAFFLLKSTDSVSALSFIYCFDRVVKIVWVNNFMGKGGKSSKEGVIWLGGATI